jgi:steroid 5-alpha reductase family enzyme
MINFTAWSLAAVPVLALMLLAWAWSVRNENVSIVDALWSLMFLLLAGSYAWLAGVAGARGWLVLALTAIWALRLSSYIAVRNHGQAEDRRYRAIRQRNQPGFAWKSLYLVFALQALLAWLIAMPLAAAMSVARPLGLLDLLGLLAFTIGLLFEAVGDAQLARFRADPSSAGRVLDQGLWRYTRHPNYFGECLLWWGFFCFAAAAGAWWTVFSPLLMTILLLRVSGVSLLESDIGQRRPEYADYIRRTSAFLPWPPARPGAVETSS